MEALFMVDAPFPRGPCCRRYVFCLVALGGAFLGGCQGPSLLLQYLNVSYEQRPDLTPPASIQSEATPQVVPINLDTVLRLAEEQNRQIMLAREKLNESQIEQQLAASAWLPDVYGGVGYYRHEGANQNPDGTFTKGSFGALFPGIEIQTELDLKEATYRRIKAGQQLWQQKGELAKVGNETLLEAATTYIDLLTARRGEAVGEQLGNYEAELLTRAEKLNNDGSLKFLVEGLKAGTAGRQQALAKLQQQGDAASMKLAYLLGLPHTARLLPLDKSLSPIDLVDASPPVEVLIDLAVKNGPGVREMEGLLETIHSGMAEMEGPKKFLPVIQLAAVEGAFGAGQDAQLDWGNRFDLGIQASWNLTEFLTARQKRQQAQSRLAQAHFSFDDLQAKLALGVQEARAEILSGKQQLEAGGEMVKHASENYRLSHLRLLGDAPGSSLGEVMQSIRALEMAHFNYLQALRDYNKAQIRLLLLLGPTACK
jgi:outer membrane protein TolC